MFWLDFNDIVLIDVWSGEWKFRVVTSACKHSQHNLNLKFKTNFKNALLIDFATTYNTSTKKVCVHLYDEDVEVK